MIAPHRDYAPIAHAFETDDITTITDSGGIAFRTFADKTGSDRHALAACIRPFGSSNYKRVIMRNKITGSSSRRR